MDSSDSVGVPSVSSLAGFSDNQYHLPQGATPSTLVFGEGMKKASKDGLSKSGVLRYSTRSTWSFVSSRNAGASQKFTIHTASRSSCPRQARAQQADRCPTTLKTAHIDTAARCPSSHPVLPSVVHKNLSPFVDVFQGHHERFFLERKLLERDVVQRCVAAVVDIPGVGGGGLEAAVRADKEESEKLEGKCHDRKF